MVVIFPGRRRLLSLILIICLCLVAYGNTLKNSFLLDDYPRVVENDFIRHWGNFPALFGRNYFLSGEPSYRPVLTFSYMVDYHLWGLNPAGYHLTNLLFHTLNSLLIFFLVFLLLKDWGLSSAAALLFSVHPVATEAVNAVGFRQDLLALFFSLLSLTFYHLLRGRRKEKRRWILLYVFSLVSFLLAVFSKENAVMLPGLIIFSDLCFSAGAGGRRLRKNAALYCGYFLGLGFYCLTRFFLIHPGPGRDIIGYGAPPLFPRLLTMTRVIVHYLRLLFFPVGLSAEYNFSVSEGFWEAKVVASAGLLLGVLVLAIFSFRRLRALAFGLGYFFIALVPAMNIIPLMNLAAERYLYFPLAGFCLGLAAAGARLYHRLRSFRRLLAAVLVLLLIFYSALTTRRNLDWRDSFTLTRKTLVRCPGSSRLHTNLGRVYLEQGKLTEALAEFQTALRLDREDYYAHNNLGLLYTEQGDYEAAIAAFREALLINPRYAKAYNNLGVVYDRKGMYEEAISEYKKAIIVDPGFARAYNNLGLAYDGLSYERAAFHCYQQAVALDPLMAEAYNNLAVVFWRRGRYAEALRLVQKSRELGYQPDPEFMKTLKKDTQEQREDSRVQGFKGSSEGKEIPRTLESSDP